MKKLSTLQQTLLLLWFVTIIFTTWVIDAGVTYQVIASKLPILNEVKELLTPFITRKYIF